MTEVLSDTTYSAEAWNEMHHYSLKGDRLDYRFGDSELVYSFDLRPGSFSLKSRWQTHRSFRSGLVLLAFPAIGLGPVLLKEHTLGNIGLWLYVHIAMLVLGVVLVVRYRSIYRGHLLRTNTGDEMFIFRDPKNSKRADDFISQISSLA